MCLFLQVLIVRCYGNNAKTTAANANVLRHLVPCCQINIGRQLMTLPFFFWDFWMIITCLHIKYVMVAWMVSSSTFNIRILLQETCLNYNQLHKTWFSKHQSSILRFLDKKNQSQYLVSKLRLIECYQLSSILLLKMLPPWPCLLLLYAFFMAAWFLSKLPPLNSREHEILIRRARAPISIFLWCLLLSLLAFIKFIIRL